MNKEEEIEDSVLFIYDYQLNYGIVGNVGKSKVFKIVKDIVVFGDM